eukprot:m.79297 g.79297  ORF g.79297 m.79297 type:complete len:70 (-) comp14514_c0_seq8:862-1071(-)
MATGQLYSSLEGDADVNTKSKFGYTALHCAALEGASIEIVKGLLSAGADINGAAEVPEYSKHVELSCAT